MDRMDREKWLNERRNHIGASDAAAILGFDERRGPLSIYNQKVNGYSQEDNDWMAFGRDVEGAIANLYHTRTGRDIEDTGSTFIIYHDDYPWIGATLDRVTYYTPKGSGPLELKHVSRYDTFPKQWREDPPMQYQAQLQIQMACANSKKGTLAAMFPGYELAYCDLKRDDDFLAYAYPILSEFWQRVIDKNPPPPDGNKGDLEAIKNMYSIPNGEIIPLDKEVLELALAWDAANKGEKKSKKEKKSLEAKLRHIMQDATFGALPDGRFLTLKLTEKAPCSVDLKAQSYRTLRLSKTMGK